jgi:Spy/CpxP family protein refolding chaperone
MRRLATVFFAGVLLAPFSLAAQDAPPTRANAAPRMRAQEHRLGLLGMGRAEGMFAPQILLSRRERLALTAEQSTQIEALGAEVKQARDKAEADAKPRQDKLAELWKADQPDATAIQAEMRGLMETRHAAALTAAAAAARAKGLLTDEQRGRVEGWADGRRMGARRGPRAGAMMRHPRAMRWF